MLVILLIVGLLIGTAAVAVSADETAMENPNLPSEWSEQASPDTVACGGGGGDGGIPG